MMRAANLIPASLSPRDRRALITGGFIAAAAIFFAFGVKPYVRAIRTTREELGVQSDLLRRERSLLASSPDFANALVNEESKLDEAVTLLFTGPDEVSATSELSDRISEAAAGNNVLIQQLETRTPQPMANGLVALGIDVKAEGDFEGVLHFLNALDRADKLITVSALTLTRTDRGSPNAGPQAEVLSISGSITGYGLSSAPSQSSPQDSVAGAR